VTEPPPPPQPPGPQEPTGQQPTISYGYPGGPPDPPVRRSKAALITAIIVGAVLVAGGGGAGIYLLTKSDDNPQGTATGAAKPGSPTNPSAPESEPGSGGSNVPSAPAPPSGEAPPAGSAAPTTRGGGGTGGGQDDAAIVQVTQKYASAVSGKDEAGAKAATCDNEPGLLYSSAEKVEVVGKPEKYGDDTASINVKVNLGGGTEPIDNFPLFMDKKNNAWCISN
jgi:hypothetical protein